VQRTIYVLCWISDLSLGSGVTAGTNSVEGHHALTKWLQFGVEGVIQENDPEEQQKRIRYLGLLALALIYRNVFEISRAIGELVGQGIDAHAQEPWPGSAADAAFCSCGDCAELGYFPMILSRATGGPDERSRA